MADEEHPHHIDIPSGVITNWLNQLKSGDSRAAQDLWQTYSASLARLAKAKLRGSSPGIADEDDVTNIAFTKLCDGMARGLFPKLDDRLDLWRLLVTLTVRAAADQAKYGRRGKRWSGRILDEATNDAALGGSDSELLRMVSKSEPSPELAAIAAEECRRLFGLLDDPSLRLVALMRFEGYQIAEIAQSMNRSVLTVARALVNIREKWLCKADE